MTMQIEQKRASAAGRCGFSYWFMPALVLLALAGCSMEPDAGQPDWSPVEGRISLADDLTGDWDSVCVLPPYTTNDRAREILGTELNVVARSDIAGSDRIALLVTLNDGEVADLYDVPRRPVDFTALGSCCFPRPATTFEVPAEGHPFAVPVDSAVDVAAACVRADTR